MNQTSGGDSRKNKRTFQDAARDLERAVEELASAATDEVSSRAARLLDEAVARVRRESGVGGEREREAEHDASADAGRSRRIHYSDYADLPRRSRKLYLDRRNRKIVGVCAGVARYFGIESWVARCAALTGLLFLPSVVFPAYWIAFICMGHPPSDARDGGRRRTRRRGARTRAARARRRAEKIRRAARHGRRSYDAEKVHRSPAPEFGAHFSPRQSLRAAQADLAEVELRLRRMEAFVTSDRYELERGLAEIGAGTTRAQAASPNPDPGGRTTEGT